jgi:predicted flap endonuclease-1-like 5' DNA nuclease
MNQLAFPFESENLAIALAEILILLALSVFLGWRLAKLIVKKRIDNLRELVDEKKLQLADHRISMNNSISQPVATNASKTVYPTTSPDHEPDDLKVIDGIGQKIEELLNKEGIHTYEQLAEAPIIRMAGILKKAGPRFQIQDPSSWPKQAELARNRKWEELDQLKVQLISGKHS